jgi:hypothetical protein
MTFRNDSRTVVVDPQSMIATVVRARMIVGWGDLE